MHTIRHVRGITLIELMVTVSIVAILASIVYPSYRNSVRKANRSEARAALVQTAEALEKCYTRYNYVYNSASCTAAAQFNSSGFFDTTTGRYRITGAVAGATFTLTATPRLAQVGDTCATLTLTDQNVRAPANCW